MSSFGIGGQMLGANANQLLGMPNAIQQQSPSSAGFTPGLMPPPPGQAPQGPQMAQPPQMQPIAGAPPTPPQMPMQGGIPQPMPQQGQGVVGIPPGNPEALSIIKSLTSRLASLTKVEEMQKGLQ